MSLKIQAEGVNRFLEMIYGPGSRPSAILEELGCTPEQVSLLRTRHLEAFVDGFVRCIAERLAQYRDGERKYRVLARRLGLDGEPSATLAVVGVEFGLSRERIRQIEESAVRRCQSMKQRHYWLESLYTCAAKLLAAEDIVLQPFAPYHSTPAAVYALASATPARQEDRDKSHWPDVPQEVINRLHENIYAIFAAAGNDITDSILADLLSGSTRTVVVALVEHYALQFAHGAFADIERKRLKALVRDARRATPRTRDEDVACVNMSEPEMEEVARLVAEVRACVGPNLSYWMYGHILHGSHGPQIDALVATYQPPHYGRLRGLGIKRVLALVKSAHMQPTVTGASPTQHVVSESDP